MTIISNSAEQTKNLGRKLAKKSKGGDIFALNGNLGSGKTTLAQGLAEGLGVKQNINSPSFVLIKTYQTKKGNFLLCHADAYRLKNSREILQAGLMEYLNNKKSILIIEWSKKINKLIANFPRYQINFKFINKNSREINIRQIKAKTS